MILTIFKFLVDVTPIVAKKSINYIIECSPGCFSNGTYFVHKFYQFNISIFLICVLMNTPAFIFAPDNLGNVAQIC